MEESLFDKLILRDNFQWVVLIGGSLWFIVCLCWTLLKAPRSRRAFDFTLCAIGPVFIALWFVYNAIMDHFGLTSVAGLALNLAIMIPIGLILGYLLHRFSPSDQKLHEDRNVDDHESRQ